MPGIRTAIIPKDISTLSGLNGKWGRMESLMDFIKMRNRQKINIIFYSLLKLAYQSEIERITKEIGCSKILLDGKKTTQNFQG